MPIEFKRHPELVIVSIRANCSDCSFTKEFPVLQNLRQGTIDDARVSAMAVIRAQHDESECVGDLYYASAI